MLWDIQCQFMTEINKWYKNISLKCKNDTITAGYVYFKYRKVSLKKILMAIKTSRDYLSYFQVWNAYKKVDKTGVE